jgi:hypothetical protein
MQARSYPVTVWSNSKTGSSATGVGPKTRAWSNASSRAAGPRAAESTDTVVRATQAPLTMAPGVTPLPDVG